MTTAPDPQTASRSERRRTRSPGLVWAIPLAALLIVAYLGVQAIVNRGEVVTVTFRRAAGAHAGETKVLYQGVEAGQLIKIVPNTDGRSLDFRLRLVPEAKQGLNSNARFWLIGASPNLADLSSLKAVVSGVAIGYAPGDGGTPQTHFDGLDKAPTVLPGDKGTRYWLAARTLGSIREGSVLLFHGQPIGKVAEVKFNGEAGFRLEVFVFKPYDSLIKPGVRFWKSTPLRLSLSNGGLNATLAPASTLLAGGIDIEVPPTAADETTVAAETEFNLYSSRSAAREGLAGPAVRYDLTFRGTASTLDEESAITLLGFQIGEIETTRLTYEEHTGEPSVLVTAVLYSQRLGVIVPSSASAADWRQATDAKLVQLLRVGYRARLQQTPAVIGNQSIALVAIKDAGAAALLHDGENSRIPTAAGSTDVADIGAQADQILTKLNRIPIEQIGRNLQQVTGQLNHTLAQVDRMVGEAQPQIGPLLTKLNQAAAEVSAAGLAAHRLLDNGGSADEANLQETLQQLNDAARSIRTFADYLSRHPDALIRGKGPEQ